jgi:K+-sensing histidine kinase KdpD
MSKRLRCTAARKQAAGDPRALRLAQELGAETATLSDPSEDKAVLRYAREHNLGKSSSAVQQRALVGANPLPTSWPAARRISIW